MTLHKLLTFDEEVDNFRKQERQIGALEYKLKVIRVLQTANYDAIIINTILDIPTVE